MRRAVMVLAALAIAGCQTADHADGLTLPATEANVAGSFTLVTANGRLVPFDAIVTTTEIWTLVGDKIVILPNGTWVDSTNYSVLNRSSLKSAAQATASAGTWVTANQQINFTMTQGGDVSFAGAVVGNGLFVNFDNTRYTYQR